MSAQLFHAGDVIRKWRKFRQWSNIELAKRADVDKNSVTRVENGESVTTDVLDRIARALGYSTADVYRALGATSELSPDEQDLLTAFRQLTIDHQRLVRDMAQGLKAADDRRRDREP